jgi:hypothetical protein
LADRATSLPVDRFAHRPLELVAGASRCLDLMPDKFELSALADTIYRALKKLGFSSTNC